MKGNVRANVDFYWAVLARPEGPPLVTSLGVDSDQRLWLEAAYLGYSPQALEKIRQDDGTMVFIYPLDGCVYVDVQAVIKHCGSPEMERKLMAVKDAVLDRLHPSNFRR
jgi:hypothetical protein